jgi:hypothetical protein
MRASLVAILILAGCTRAGWRAPASADPRADGPRDQAVGDHAIGDVRQDANAPDAAVARDAAGLADRATDHRSPDAPTIDLQPTSADLGTVGVITTVVSATGTALCSTGTVVGGGGSCAVGKALARTFPAPGGGWQATCADGNAANAFAVCAGPPVAPVVVQRPVTSAVATFDVPCGAGEQIVGGGCSCGGGALLHGSAPWSNSGWRCSCSVAAAHTGVALCIPQALAQNVGLGRNGSQANTTQPTMYCQAATPKALGGGCYSGGAPPSTSVEKSAPLGSNGWFCRLAATASNSAWAMCAR